MRKAFLLLLLLPLAFGLEVSYEVIPQAVVPDDTLRIVFTVKGYAENLEYKLISPYETFWSDVGDVSGVGSFVVYVKVPKSSPGLHFAQIKLRFYEEGNYRETLLSIPYRVLSDPLEVEVFGTPVPRTKSSFLVRIVPSVPLRNVKVYLIPSLEGYLERKYVDGKLELEFRVIPDCREGIQELNVIVEGVSDEPIVVKKSFTFFCHPKEPLRIESNLPSHLSPGIHSAVFTIKNEGDVPLNLFYKVSANVPIGGSVSGVVALGSRGTTKVPVTFSVEEEDQVTITLSVWGDVNGSYTFSSRVDKSPDVVVYVKNAYWKDRPYATVEVSNVGEGEAKNLLLTVNGRTFFIGTLTSGDYDAVDVPIEENVLNIRLSYLYQGKRIEINKEIPVVLPKREGGIPLWVLILLVPIAYFLWRRKHAGSPSDGT